MTKKNKTLCDWNKKKYAGDFEKLKALVSDPEFVCVNCGRAAKAKKYLCHPLPLDRDRQS